MTPCVNRAQILDRVPPTYPLPTKAVFRYAPPDDASVAQDVCLQPGVLELATVSVYVNGTFVWCGPRLPMALHACMHACM